MQLTLNLKALTAALLFASTEETRYYLNGVCIETDEHGDTIYVATNGHVLFAHRERSIGGDNFRGSMIVPSWVISGFKPSRIRKQPLAHMVVDERIINGTITHEQTPRDFKAVDGTFPDWRRVVPPVPETPAIAQFDPNYVAVLGKVSKIMGYGVPFLHHDGCGACLVNWATGDTIGVIMPMRHDKKPYGRPDWATRPDAAPAQAAMSAPQATNAAA